MHHPRPTAPLQNIERPNSVYRYYDHAGRLIYVGITARGITRQHEHNASSDFWPYVATQQVEHCPDRETALRVERALIEAHRPPFNKTHNGDWERLRAAYLRIAEAERAYTAALSGEPLDCGHCSSCQGRRKHPEDEAKWGPWGPCRREREAAEDQDPCPECGRWDCPYPDGFDGGHSRGWSEGYDRGVERGREQVSEELETARVADLSLQIVIDGQWARYGHPILPGFTARDDSLRRMSNAVGALGLDGAIVELMPPDPWATPDREGA